MDYLLPDTDGTIKDTVFRLLLNYLFCYEG